MQKTQPEVVVKRGSISVSIFGSKGEGYRLAPNRTYKSKAGKWEYSTSFYFADIANLKSVLEDAERYLVAKDVGIVVPTAERAAAPA